MFFVGKNRTLVRGTLLLTLSGLALRGLGVLFQSILARRVGAQGMGLLHLILTVGTLAGTLGSAGVRVAALQLCARAWGREDRSELTAAVRACLGYGLLGSGAAGLGLALLARPIGLLLLKDLRAVPALRTLGLLLPGTVLAGVLRSAWTACGRVKELVRVDLGERLLSAGVTLFLLSLAGEDPARVCQAVAAGSYGTGVLSFLVLWVRFRGASPLRSVPRAEGQWPPLRRGAKRDASPGDRAGAGGRGRRAGEPGLCECCRRERAGRRGRRPLRGGAKRGVPPVARTALPLGLNDCLRAGLGALEQLLIPWGLERHASRAGALAAYGVVSGMVFPLLWVPAEGIFALSELLVSELARLLAKKDRRRLRRLAGKSLLLTALLALGVGSLLWLWGDFLGRRLYHSPEAGRLLRIFAPMVLFLYPDAVVDGLQKGLGQQLHLVRYNSFTNVIDVLGLWLLLPRLGLWGYVITYCLSHLVNLFLSLRRLLTVLERPELCQILDSGQREPDAG